MYNQGTYVETPLLNGYVHRSDASDIFRIKKEELKLFFSAKNRALPDNEGESRTALNILRDCGYAEGLCQLLSTDKDTGIVGDKADLKRRQLNFGKHKIRMPVIDSFMTLAAR